MRRLGIILFALGFWLIGNCEIIINEVFYDAVGSDDQQEWIELYNNGLEDINLQGWLLQAGGGNFSDLYTFPSIVIRAGAFFLISEFPHPLSNMITELGFENGGSATDGVRIINPANLYHDTILYDSPNSNNLQGDSQIQTPCINPAPGYSLARISDGVDTNLADDWFSCSNPTPGTTNNIEKTVTLKSCEAVTNGGSIDISTVILNLSTCLVDNRDLGIKISFNSELKNYDDLSMIAALDSITYCVSIENEFHEAGQLEVELINNSNTHIVDNLWVKWISYQNPVLSLSEIMYYPQVNQTEWVEVKLLNDIVDSEISIFDATGSQAEAVINGRSGDYIVIAEDRSNLLNTFSHCDSLKVFQAKAWVRLNNTGDSLVLKYFDSLLDSLSYENNSTSQGYSLEYSEINNNWYPSSAGQGASPTEANSSFSNPQVNDGSGVKVVNNLISIKRGRVFSVNFELQKLVNSLELQLFDIRGKELNTIRANFSNQYSGEYSWDGYLQGKYLPSGLYPAIIKIKAENGRCLEEKKIIITINR